MEKLKELPLSIEWYENYNDIPDSKVHGANMGPIWGQQDPDGPHVGPMNLVIWDMWPDLH